MPVSVPRGGMQIDLDIAGPGKIVVELDQRIAKIGAGLVIPEPGVKNSNRPTVQGDESVPTEALMLPDRLQEALGRGAVGGFLEHKNAQGPGAPLDVEI
jgi:hypothetical protein